MDIQTRKIEFIKEFLTVQSEELISSLENLLKNKNKGFKQFTVEELNERIDRSLEDSDSDNVLESNELLSEIREWL